MSAPERMRKQAVGVSWSRMARWRRVREVPSGVRCQALGSQPWIIWEGRREGGECNVNRSVCTLKYET